MLTTQEQIEAKVDKLFDSFDRAHFDVNKIKSFIHTIREEDRAEMVKWVENLQITGRNVFLGDDTKEKAEIMQELYNCGIKPVLLKELGITKE